MLAHRPISKDCRCHLTHTCLTFGSAAYVRGLGARVQQLTPVDGAGWLVGTDHPYNFDRVLLACPPLEAARRPDGSTYAAHRSVRISRKTGKEI